MTQETRPDRTVRQANVTGLPRADDVLAADPNRVFSAAHLAQQLDRLRSRDTEGNARPRVGLTRLAKSTGIPRSTLHTYLSGLTLPGAEALDAIVLALGCPPARAREWGEAWERVTAASRGGGSSSHVSELSTFFELEHEVRQRLARPRDHRHDQVEPVALAKRVAIGASRQTDVLELRLTLRALTDGADRWLLYLPDGDSVGDLHHLNVTNARNCLEGQHQFLDGPQVLAVELLFGERLHAGETHEIEFSLDYLGNRTRGKTSQAPEIATPSEWCNYVLWGFRRQGPSYTLQVSFQPEDTPQNLRQVHQGHPGGPEDKVHDLRITRWHTVSIGLDHPAPGLHGIRWSWPTN